MWCLHKWGKWEYYIVPIQRAWNWGLYPKWKKCEDEWKRRWCSKCGLKKEIFIKYTRIT